MNRTADRSLEVSLLSSDNGLMEPEDWPTESANNVKLLVPDEWKSDSSHCILRYNATERLLAVVSVDEPDLVLDIIDPDDMVGADLEVQMTGNAVEGLRSTNSSRNTTSKGRATNEPASDTPEDTQAAAVLTIYAYPRKDPTLVSWMNWCAITSFKPKPNPNYKRPTDVSKFGHRYAHHRRFAVAPAEDLQNCSILVNALRKMATGRSSSDNHTPPKYLIVVNSKSKNGAALCEGQVQPMLEQAGVECDVLISTHAKHAQERLESHGPDEKDIKEYDGLILMGGDGIIHEALNGIMARKDGKEILKKVKIGAIGCGTCNGFTTSLAMESNEKYGVMGEAFLIAKDRFLWVDLSRYTTTSTSYISFLTFSWAIIADIDIESECLHWLGEPRVDVWAVLRVLFLRRYRARFSYLSPSKIADKTKPISNMPALSEEVPSDWETIEDDFLLFWASQVSHAAMHTHQSPNSHLEDGIFQIMIVRGNTSRYRLARILLGLESASHVDMPNVEFVQCVAYRLEPLTPGSYNDVDGEVVEDGPIQAQVLPASVQVFCNSHSYIE